jgi:hypothetical protein
MVKAELPEPQFPTVETGGPTDTTLEVGIALCRCWSPRQLQLPEGKAMADDAITGNEWGT